MSSHVLKIEFRLTVTQLKRLPVVLNLCICAAAYNNLHVDYYKLSIQIKQVIICLLFSEPLKINEVEIKPQKMMGFIKWSRRLCYFMSQKIAYLLLLATKGPEKEIWEAVRSYRRATI